MQKTGVKQTNHTEMGGGGRNRVKGRSQDKGGRQGEKDHKNEDEETSKLDIPHLSPTNNPVAERRQGAGGEGEEDKPLSHATA